MMKLRFGYCFHPSISHTKEEIGAIHVHVSVMNIILLFEHGGTTQALYPYTLSTYTYTYVYMYLNLNGPLDAASGFILDSGFGDEALGCWIQIWN